MVEHCLSIFVTVWRGWAIIGFICDYINVLNHPKAVGLTSACCGVEAIKTVVPDFVIAIFLLSTGEGFPYGFGCSYYIHPVTWYLNEAIA